jgi:hypothetical protein
LLFASFISISLLFSSQLRPGIKSWPACVDLQAMGLGV